MRTKLYSLLIITSFAYANEVSVFGAGNLDSPNPYGLNSTEKVILKNKKELTSIDTKVKVVKSSLQLINERIDGLESIYEGDTQKLNTTVQKVEKNIIDIENNKNLVEKSQQDIENIRIVVNQLLNIQEQQNLENKKNIDSLKLALENLSKTVDEINSKYISDVEFKKNMAQFVTLEQYNSTSKSSKKSSKKSSSNSDFDGKSKKSLLEDARAYFARDYFTKAIPIFEYLLEKNYRPAESSYHLGEIWYYRKKYKDAIHYFKKSAILYDKAKYMPKLMLHSALSFEKLGDIENASNFYSTLIDLYPDTKESKIASKNILNMK